MHALKIIYDQALIEINWVHTHSGETQKPRNIGSWGNSIVKCQGKEKKSSKPWKMKTCQVSGFWPETLDILVMF